MSFKIGDIVRRVANVRTPAHKCLVKVVPAPENAIPAPFNALWVRCVQSGESCWHDLRATYYGREVDYVEVEPVLAMLFQREE